MKAKANASLASVDWAWKDKRPSNDCTESLSADERFHLAALALRFQSGQKGWHSGAASVLSRLTLPLHKTLDYLGATTTEKRNSTVRNTAVCLIIRAMNHWQIAYWGFTSQQWHELIGNDYYAYIARHGCTANARHQIIALAYCFVILMTIGLLVAFHGVALQQRFSDRMHFWLAISPSWQNYLLAAIRKPETLLRSDAPLQVYF